MWAWEALKTLARALTYPGRRQGEQLTAEEIARRFQDQPNSLHPALQLVGRYIVEAKGDIDLAYRRCSASRRPPGFDAASVWSIACDYLFELLPGREVQDELSPN